MNIPINKDFETEYKHNAWKGFTPREVKYIVAGLITALASGLLMIFVLKIHYQIGIFTGILTMLPLVRIGFWKSPNGLTLVDNHKAKKYRISTRILVYKAREYMPYEPKEEEPLKVRSKKELKDMKKKHKKYVRGRRRELRREGKRNGVE